jgi:hypothetical protein
MEKTMSEGDNLFKNIDEAKAYANALTDPVAKAMCWALYTTLMFKMTDVELVGGFDLLYLFKLLNEFASDREQLDYLVSLGKQTAAVDDEQRDLS